MQLSAGMLQEIPAHTYCYMCHYPHAFLQKIPPHTAQVFAPVSARLHCRLRGCIAVMVVLPSRCRHVAVASLHRTAWAPHRVTVRNVGDLPTSLELHLPVVQPTRCTRTEEVDPQKRALGEALMLTHVESWSKGCDSMIQQTL